MKQNDITRGVWTLFESTKDAVTAQIVNAVAAHQLRIERDVLPTLVAVIKDAMEQSYTRGYKNVEKAVEKALAEARNSSPSQANNPPAGRSKKNRD